MNNAFRALWWRELTLYRRNLVSEGILNLLLPILFFLFFGLGFQAIVGTMDGIPYLAYLIPGLVLLTIALTAFDSLAWFHVTNRRNRQWDEVILMGAFPNKPGLLLAELTLGATKGLVHGIIILLITIFLAGTSGIHVNIQAFLVFMLLTAIQFAAWGHLAGMYTPPGPLLGRLVTFFIFPIFLVSGLGWEISGYSPVFESLVYWLPTHTLVAGAQSGFLRGTIENLFLIIAFIETALLVGVVHLLTDNRGRA
ncbi:MAG: ABC transporter permease [Candidatus Marinimicrobia bacterium]|nr:ABC transporter permease [Candidatus Neomarinimicrobiota bacterium]MCF7840006.1 ABC transporter permease [Candidatus Neomarinimicrobiota bacterium]